MKRFRILLAAILVVTIVFGLLACKKKIDLQTEKEAIQYLQEYVEDNNKWKKIANTLGLSTSTKAKISFKSSSYAQMEDGTWTVVLHGSMSGSAFSYMASVSTDGNVAEIGVIAGTANNVHKS